MGAVNSLLVRREWWVVGSRSTVPQARGGSLVCEWVGQRVQSRSNRVKAEFYYV